MHELDAEGLAVGAPQDRQDLSQRPELQPQNHVEKDLAVHVGLGEAVGARVEILFVMVRLEAERVEIGIEMTARPIGTDQHQGVDGVAGRLLDGGGRKFDSGGLRSRLHLVAECLLDLAPIAVERGNELAARALRPVRQLPRWPLRVPHDIGALVLQALEERLPVGIDRLGVGLVARIEVLDVVGIAAIEERGAGESGVGVLTGHAQVLLAGWQGLEPPI